ncbi:hypothetical protein AVEN_105253-1 [Araneus ventricosus]|uniref:Uncharacterized protein n=1 Tax=Araneus ventricosus TaxID=182803 RepID=A0A4Y2U182_ARAVE|nr:hypothetical protein AVEN_96382-1 [Araneus ventricosus]GBO05724.1 hypothetical protein AVEN_117950-1 [Araneus ventricosus]GBO34109.1 hypothetical protein AVEN_101007-1 [Araneus ventricosus]GBO34119.1 hypothetical protein AVEN_105253-1 [Araneus ventricosus]
MQSGRNREFSDPYYSGLPAHKFCINMTSCARPRAEVITRCARLPELKVAIGCRAPFQGRGARFRGRGVQNSKDWGVKSASFVTDITPLCWRMDYSMVGR